MHDNERTATDVSPPELGQRAQLLVDPTGRYWWDGQVWVPLPARARSRFTRNAIVGVILVLALAVGALVVFRQLNGSEPDGDSAAGLAERPAEDAFI